MSALLTSSLGLSSRSGDNNHANVGNAHVRIFISAITVTTLVILLNEMVIVSHPQFRNVLVCSRRFMWRRLLSVTYYQRLNSLLDFLTFGIDLHKNVYSKREPHGERSVTVTLS